MAFALKLPLFPALQWILNAHTEGSVESSIILAGLVLKVAWLGIWRFVVSPACVAMGESESMCDLLAMICLAQVGWGVISWLDSKRIIAATSIAHMTAGVITLVILDDNMM